VVFITIKKRSPSKITFFDKEESAMEVKAVLYANIPSRRGYLLYEISL